MESFDLKNRFFYMDGPDQYLDIGRYGEWTRQYCGKCALQKKGTSYDCPLLKAMDHAIVQSRGIMPMPIAKQVWDNPEARYEGSNAC